MSTWPEESAPSPIDPSLNRTRIKHKPIKLLLSCVLFLLIFKINFLFPDLNIIHEIWILITAAILLLLYAPWRLMHLGTADKYELYLISLSLVIPVLATITASVTFGQPILYGLLAQRGFVLVLGAPLLLRYLLNKQIVNLSDLLHGLSILAWTTLLLYTFLTLALDPSKYYQEYGVSFSSTGDADARFKFSITFILYGYFFYLFKAYRTKRLYHYFNCLLFFIYIAVINRGRAILISLLAASFLSIYWWRPKKKRMLPIILKFGFSICILLFLGYAIFPDFYRLVFEKFSDALLVLLKGETSNDVSANARIIEIGAVLPYIKNNFIFGSGFLSNRWSGGPRSILNEYFYPTDIGIFGALFSYGLLGIVLLGMQFKYGYKFSKMIPQSTHPLNEHTNAIRGLLVFTAIVSVASASFAFHPEQISILAMLLQYIAIKTSPPLAQAS